MRTLGLMAGALIFGHVLGMSGQAAEVMLKSVDMEPPKELGESIRKLVATKAVQLSAGDKTLYQFWLVNELPVTSPPVSPAKGLESIAEITLLGVATVGEGLRDYKDNEIAPGTYTMRFSLQPKDGDHLGTSEFPYFAVLTPVKSDRELQSIKTYKALMKASGKSTATGHPAVLALRPPAAESGTTPTVDEPAPEHKALRLQLPAKASGAASTTPITLELVFEGKFKS